MKKICLLLFVLLLMIASCSEDQFDLIATNDKVPDEITVPAVKSFESYNKIIIEWDRDEGADEYALYRAYENPDYDYKEIYRGGECMYIDNVADYDKGTFFYYKLAKKRGQKEFGKSKYVCGVAAIINNDYLEDNNSEEKSVNISSRYTVNANMYYYRDSSGNELIDYDYYSITLEANFRAHYVLDIEYAGDPSFNLISIYSNTGNGGEVNEESGFDILNNYNDKRTLSFCLKLDTSSVILPAGKAYIALPYVLKLTAIDPIPPQ